MGRLQKLLERMLSGTSDANLRFEDLRYVLAALGFDERIKGGHHIFTRSGVDEIINLQPRPNGRAKPYQVKQVRAAIVKYELAGGADEK